MNTLFNRGTQLTSVQSKTINLFNKLPYAKNLKKSVDLI
jgi:hypothetical protein